MQYLSNPTCAGYSYHPPAYGFYWNTNSWFNKCAINKACATNDAHANSCHFIILPSMSIWGHGVVFYRQLPCLSELSLRN
jgi:hypothetical protein